MFHGVFQSVVMMFVGGLMVALAVEKCNLHKRIAIGILYLLGTKPLW
jgi:sodium-dependent dicarboxylate transporter 2/3/5